MKKKRIAVVGAGYISRNYHCPALVKLREKQPWIELTAVCDLIPERTSEAKAAFGFKAGYTDIESLLSNEKIDAAYIAVQANIVSDGTSNIRFDLMDDGTSIAYFLSSATALVSNVPGALTVSTSKVAADSVLGVAVTQGVSGTAATKAAIILQYHNTDSN